MFLLVNKPKGITSHGVVAKIRKLVNPKNPTSSRLRGPKVGHAGTLDPNATGLLIIAIGRDSTKKIKKFVKKDKVYDAEIFLGEERDTDDVEGVVVHTCDPKLISDNPTLSDIKDVLIGFVGEQMQTPPIYSAIKIKGKKAYQEARKGNKIKLDPRKVTIYSIKVKSYHFPILKIRLKVSSGTYIRSIARDLGRKLGTYGYLKNLERVEIGKYSLKEARNLEELNVDNWKDKCFSN